MNQETSKRIIGLDMHPDVFSAAAVQGEDPLRAKTLWVHDRRKTGELERWAKKNLNMHDVVVLEASGNSFEVVERLAGCGILAMVLESVQAGSVKDNYCNDDRHSAVKLARVYLSGLAKIVWTPDERTREYREIFFAHRNAVVDTTRARNRMRSYLNEHCVRLQAKVALSKETTLAAIKAARKWTLVQLTLLEQRHAQLLEAERRRKAFEQIMIQELVANPKWAQLWRLMGVRHRVAFALMAIIGDIRRFETAKKLVGYIGLAPGKTQSGNNKDGTTRGIGGFGRRDLRGLLLQSAQNALSQKESPLHKWGWRLTIRKHRNLAAAAVARKLTVAIWHLLMGHFTPLTELTEHLHAKLLKLATVLGKETLQSMGFKNRDAFILSNLNNIQLQT